MPEPKIDDNPFTNGPRWTLETRDAVARALFALDHPDVDWADIRHDHAVDAGVAKVRAHEALKAVADVGVLAVPEVSKVVAAALEWAATGRAGGFDHMAASLRLLAALDVLLTPTEPRS